MPSLPNRHPGESRDSCPVIAIRNPSKDSSAAGKWLPVVMFVGLSLALTACVSGKPAPDTYTSSKTGAVTAIESDRDACIRSCNNEYERCGDMLSSTRNDVGAQPMGRTFGIGSDCRAALQSCLPRCKGR